MSERLKVQGRVSGEVRDGDQVPGMPHAICHACGLGYRCDDRDCPNDKPNPIWAGLDPNEVVGHKTFDTGGRDEHGLPKFRHEPLTRAEGEALWARAKEREAKRAADMPDEQSAINAMHDAWLRLKELGWREGMYAPRDGTTFKVIEIGSTGIFDCDCHGEWPDCTWTAYDEHDAYPSSQAPAMFKLMPDDQGKYDARMAEAVKRYQN